MALQRKLVKNTNRPRYEIYFGGGRVIVGGSRGWAINRQFDREPYSVYIPNGFTLSTMLVESFFSELQEQINMAVRDLKDAGL